MEKQLLFSIIQKDLKINYFSGTGKGGQHRNKHQNCVRIHHPESGAIATGQSHRERHANLKEAFHNLASNPKFRLWHHRKVHEVLAGKRIEDTVKEMMRSENIKVEVKENGK